MVWITAQYKQTTVSVFYRNVSTKCPLKPSGHRANYCNCVSSFFFFLQTRGQVKIIVCGNRQNAMDTVDKAYIVNRLEH